MSDLTAAPPAGPGRGGAATIESLQRLAGSGRVPPPEQVATRIRAAGVLYYIETWLLAARAWALSLVVVMVFEPLLYLIALGWGLGALVDRGVGTVGGEPYLVFVGPALLVATLGMAAPQETTHPVMAGFKWRRLYFAPAATPLTPAQIALGHLFGAGVRFLLQAALFWVALVAFGAVRSPWSWLTILIGVLVAFAIGAPIQAYAATLEQESAQFAFIQRFIIMPMFLFAGTFFPLSQMPWFLHWIGWISPVWHGTELARAVSYGAPMAWPWWIHLGYLLALTVGGLLLGTRFYTRRLRR